MEAEERDVLDDAAATERNRVETCLANQQVGADGAAGVRTAEGHGCSLPVVVTCSMMSAVLARKLKVEGARMMALPSS